MFYGTPVMYGRGISLLFSKLFCFVSPHWSKKRFALAKPHPKTPATNIASDMIGKYVSETTSSPQNSEGQESLGS